MHTTFYTFTLQKNTRTPTIFMNESFWKVLHKPFFVISDTAYRWRQAVAFGTFVFLFLWIFRPFRIEEMDQPLVLICVGFGLVTFVSMVILNVLVPKLIPRFFQEEKWTVGKELLSTLTHIFLIGLANFLFFSYYGQRYFSWGVLLWFQGVTLAVGAIPSAMVILWKESQDRRKFESGAGEMNKNLPFHQVDVGAESDKRTLEIHSQTADENLIVRPADIYYIKAADNYIEVYYRSGGEVSRRILRNTLKSVEQDLESHPDLFRCHKSYLVNLSHVHHLSGNAQGYKLHLQQVDEPIPVSRQHNESIKNRFAIHP